MTAVKSFIVQAPNCLFVKPMRLHEKSFYFVNYHGFLERQVVSSVYNKDG